MNAVNGIQLFYTILSGTTVFVLGQILQRFVFEPIQQYKRVVGKIDNQLKFFSNVLTSGGLSRKKDISLAHGTMRSLSSELESIYKQIPCKSIFSLFHIIPHKINIAMAARKLIFLSNEGGKRVQSIDKCDEAITTIRRMLGIEELGKQ